MVETLQLAIDNLPFRQLGKPEIIIIGNFPSVRVGRGSTDILVIEIPDAAGLGWTRNIELGKW
jgi:hypothetical protein